MIVEEVTSQLDKYIDLMKTQGKELEHIIISDEQYYLLSNKGKNELRDYRGYILIVKNIKGKGHG